MNLDFNFYNPTKIFFGKESMKYLSEELENYGPNILLVYGKSSIKKSGLYDDIISVLKKCGKNVTELSGVKSNPTYMQMMEGVRLVKENHTDLILAVGGGSVIDCAKGISVSAYCKGDPWQRYWIDFEDVDNEIVPVGCVLTMAGTGSEERRFRHYQRGEKVKAGRTYPSIVNPRFSILNPEYTFTVPKKQMVSGVFDIMSHLMEQYFTGTDDNTTDYIIEGIMQSPDRKFKSSDESS